MLQVLKRLNGLNGVAWGSKASVALPAGPTYTEIHLETSLTAEQIRQVNVILNGETIVQVSGADLVMMEKYKKHHIQEATFDNDGVLTQKGIFVIPFTNPTAKNQNGANFGGLVTLKGENITLEIEIADGTGALSLGGFSYSTFAQARRIWEPNIKTHIFQANSTGLNDYPNFPSSDKVNLRRMYFKGDISRLVLERDGTTLFDASKGVYEFQQVRVGRVPQTGYFTFDPTIYGYEMADVLNTGKVSEFVFRLDLGTAAAVPILVESIKQVNTLQA
ncbi:major capsid protein P2 [Marinomonas transparens]|uniref:Viral coat protein P2 N-terminal domain-containing protein n=1 Tax=Marinomonas transparens TaxID=2795388 RepID=A0A934JXV4_9GAMM|nr:major capsid protein P2 [Marinomonas transparens]MBJ7539255.1 hypothetical protein [Marinomonas transparens]